MIPLVLLHGFLGSPDDWDPLRERLVGVDLVTPRLPEMSNWDETILALQHELPPNSIIGGYSMGARLALGCAIAAPERYCGLLLISGNPGIDATERDTRWRHDQAVSNELETGNLEEFLRNWYSQAIFQGLTDDQVNYLVSKRLLTNRSYQAALLRANSVARQPNYWDELSHLQVPVMAVAGERDVKYAAIARRLTNTIPRGRCELLSDCGHIVHFEQPDELARMIAEFVADAASVRVQTPVNNWAAGRNKPTRRQH